MGLLVSTYMKGSKFRDKKIKEPTYQIGPFGRDILKQSIMLNIL